MIDLTPLCGPARSCLSLLAAAATAGLFVGPVLAQNRPVSVRLGSSVTWDSNVFRLPDFALDPQLAQGISGRSDRISKTDIGLSLDKSYSLQHLLLDVTRSSTRYERFTSRDFDALSYRAEWQWHVTPRIGGSLGASRDTSEVSFEDALLGTQRNLRVSTERHFNLDGLLFGGWHLFSRIAVSETRTEQTFLAQPGSRIDNAEVGIKYVAASQSSVTAIRRSQEGIVPGKPLDTVNFIDNQFSVKESELQLAWRLSGRSTVNGRLTRIERRNTHLPQRDFSATASELSYLWTPTGRLTINLTGSRKISPWTADTQASYRVDDSLSFAPTWQISGKVAARLRSLYQVSGFQGPIAPLVGVPRRDTLRSLQLSLDWLPLRSVTLGATLQHDRRGSTSALAEFDATTASVNAALKF